jgi:hypothetical protein
MAQKPICYRCAAAVGEDWLFVDRLPVVPNECADCRHRRATVRMEPSRYRQLKIRAGLNPDMPASEQEATDGKPG